MSFPTSKPMMIHELPRLMTCLISNEWAFGCNIGESDRVFEWRTKVGETLGAMLVNQTVYLSDPLKWVGIWVQYW